MARGAWTALPEAGDTMLGGVKSVKSWFRRRLGRDVDDEETDAEDDLDDDEEEPEYGSLVRKGEQVTLRQHVPLNREAFQRWYADPEIANLLRHDLEPLTDWQSRGYFDSFILPSSARGTCFAIHTRKGKRLIGTTAVTDMSRSGGVASALFRIVIGEKEVWGQGYGTEATRLVMDEAFESLSLDEVRLEVFSHNQRAIAAYERVGFVVTGEHVEWVARRQTELRVIEMRLNRADFLEASGEREPGRRGSASGAKSPKDARAAEREARQQAHAARREKKREKHERKAARGHAPGDPVPSDPGTD
ncbi:MAG: GNAT family protein [Thermomicrobiales bacterium]